LSLITLAYRALPLSCEAPPPVTAPVWDLPLRMAAATLMVVGITVVSGVLGPQLSGLLSTFPVFICVMSAFSHYLYGSRAVRKFERGVIAGSYAFAVFFIVTVAALPRWNPVMVYTAATACALASDFVIFRVLYGKKPPPGCKTGWR
jgi:uncharacterized membrane protein (GlpM family)